MFWRFYLEEGSRGKVGESKLQNFVIMPNHIQRCKTFKWCNKLERFAWTCTSILVHSLQQSPCGSD
jgi:hypothetical protein